MIRKITDKIVLVLAFLFIGWISFIPQPLQDKYANLVVIILVLCLAVLFFFRRAKFKDDFFSGQDKFFWLYLALLGINVWFSEDVRSSLAFYRHFVFSCLAIYFIFKNEIKLLKPERIFYCLVICAGLVSILAIWEIVSGSNFLYPSFVPNPYYQCFIGRRAMSTQLHPIVLGCYLVTILPMAYYFFRAATSWLKRIFSAFFLLLIFAGLVLTFSRCSWFILFCVISLGLILKRKARYIVLIWLLFLGLMFIAGQPRFRGSAFGRLRFEMVRWHLNYGNRPLQYITTKNILKKHPFVGVGLTLYRVMYDEYAVRPLPWELRVPESIYLMHLAESGIIGFLGFGLVLLHLFKGFWQKVKESSEEKNFWLAIFLSFVALLLNFGWFDGFGWKSPLYLFWVFAGVMAGVNQTGAKG